MSRLTRRAEPSPVAAAAAPVVPLAALPYPVPQVPVDNAGVVAESEPETPLRTKQGGYYATKADVERARAAWKNTELLPGGCASWSDYQLQALMEKVERDEAEHNGGNPWPPLPAGRVKHNPRPAG